MIELSHLVVFFLVFNSLFECHISNTIKYTNIQQNKTYLISSPFGLTRHYRLQHGILQSLSQFKQYVHN